jgi:hypothetical protein
MKVERGERAVATTAHERVRAPSIDGVWAILPVVVPVLVTLMSTMLAIDLAYHVRAGDLILDTRAIPRVDTFTFTMAGRAWLDQQWGAQLLMALAHRAGGWGALAILRALLIGATFGMTYRTCRVRGAAPIAASCLALGGFVVSLQALAMRPQLLAVPLFAASLLVLVERDAHPRRLWLIPVMAALWANLHGSFVMAPALVALALIEDLGRRERAGARRLAAVGGLTVLATLCTPFGFHVWTYAIDLSTNPVIRDSVTEWAPITLSSFAGVGFFLTAGACAAWLALRGEPTPWTDLAWLGAFFLLALPAARGVIWWGLVAPVVMAGLLPHRVRDGVSRVRAGSPALNLTVVTVLVVATLGALVRVRQAPDAALLREAPMGLTAAVAAAVPAGSRLVVPEPWGSWFEFAVPDVPLFVDPRIELFPQSVWEDYTTLRISRDGWQRVLDRWDADAIVIDTRDWTLGDRLASDPSWRLAYRDHDGELFVRS